MSEPLISSLAVNFGFSDFRPGQHEAIRQLLRGRDTLVVMPTGAGKSLIYQLAALHLPGVTLVVSPLIALMKDQVDQLQHYNVPATYINSSLTAVQQRERLSMMAEGTYRLVYLAPERFRSLAFRSALQQLRISLLAVDEAHCISQWGHDFRPDYLYISAARSEMESPVTAAFTATATPEVQQDIITALRMDLPCKVIKGFNRPELCFEVFYTPDITEKLRALLKLLENWQEGAAIIYAGTRRDAEELAEFVHLVCGLEADYYHAGLDPESRSRIQESFSSGKLSVVCATSAFGMGIDRPDVRLVVHFSLPESLEAYYQEAGRSGRDGQPSRAILFYAPEDRRLQEHLVDHNHPDPEELVDLYEILQKRHFPKFRVSREQLALETGFPEVKIRTGLAQLEHAGAIRYHGDDGAKMLITVKTWDLIAAKNCFATTNKRREERSKRLGDMVMYAEANQCRRRILLEYFGDREEAGTSPCCDNCLQTENPKEAKKNTTAALSEDLRTALVILDTVRRLKIGLGWYKLAQMLKGSRAQGIRKLGLDRHIYYGRLNEFTLKEIEDMIRQLIALRYLKKTGGEFAVLGLTPKGANAILSEESISLSLPRQVKLHPEDENAAAHHIGETVEYTERLLNEGLSVSKISEKRGLNIETIFSHCSQLIECGRIGISGIVSENDEQIITKAIRCFGEPVVISALKANLPGTIGYGKIRCVLAAQKANGKQRCQNRKDGSSASAEAASDQNQQPGDSVLHLIESLKSPEGDVRRLSASALGKIGDQRAVEPLLSLLEEEEDSQVLQSGVKALGKLGDHRARPFLEKIVDDDCKADCVRTTARIALKRLSSGSRWDSVKEFLSRPLPRPLKGPWDAGWALGFHSGFNGSTWSRSQTGHLVYRLKYGHDASVIPRLVKQTKVLMKDHPEFCRVNALIPVPPTMTRDFDPVMSFADALGSALKLPVLRILRKKRKTTPQKNLHTLAQKRANVRGAFEVTEPVSRESLIVIDDLYDSGATMEEITWVLKSAGAENICVLTLTKTIHSDI